MKNKGFVIGLSLLIGILCVYYLSFTFVSNNVEKQITAQATDAKGNVDFQKKRELLKAKNNEIVYNLGFVSYTYEEVKKKELSLGLDLQGGMHVTLEVSPVDIIQKLASRRAKAPEFKKALEVAQKKQQSSQASFARLFAEAMQEVKPGAQLASYFVGTANKDLTLSSSNNEVVDYLEDRIDESVDVAYQVLQNRIDKFGVSNPSLKKLSTSGRIEVELPGVNDPEYAEKFLTSSATLEFWAVHDGPAISASLDQFITYLDLQDSLSNPSKKEIPKDIFGNLDSTAKKDTASTQGKKAVNPEDIFGTKKIQDSTENKKDSTVVAKTEDTTKKTADTNLAKKDEPKKDTTDQGPQRGAAFGKLFRVYGNSLLVNLKDTAKVNEIFSRSEVKQMFPEDLVFMWAVKPMPKGNLDQTLRGDVAKSNSDMLEIYFLRKSGLDKGPMLGGDVVIDARQNFDPVSGYASVSMQMNIKGAAEWQRITRENTGKPIAIVLDNYVYSAPNVNGEIAGGNSQITGNFSIQEAQDLANVLKSGKLPAKTRAIEKSVVGPSLGQESIQQGIISTLMALAFVFAFILVYYSFAGFVACIALIINIIFTIGVLAQFGTVLTLSGIAGFVLSVAMSVDANVLINERIREELRVGKTLKDAIKTGYDKAYSSILDSNITTFIIGVILFVMGQGLVKGFAVTLMIGIACSLFCAVFITRLIIEAMVNRGRDLTFKSIFFNSTFAKTNFDFVSLRKKAYVFSAVLIVVGLLAALIQGGLTLGVDFKGGRSYTVAFNQPVSANELRAELNKTFESNTEVKTFNANNQLKITTGYMIEDESAKADTLVSNKLQQALGKFKNQNPKILSTTKVGASIADDILQSSLVAVFVAVVAMFIYILARFRYWQYGVGVAVSLAHNILVVFALVAIFQLLGVNFEIDQVFIAAVLTVVGYSINDTVVVFDRIREFAKQGITGSNFANQLNESINDTLSRTVVTGITTIVTTLILLFFAGEVLRGFSFSMFIGIVFGTYSSVFIAAPVVLDLARKKGLDAIAEQQALQAQNQKESKKKIIDMP